MIFEIDFETLYGQFYICDKNSPFDTGEATFWSDEALMEGLAIGTNILGVASYGHVKGEISLIKKERNDLDFKGFTHIVEASIEIPTGIIQIIPFDSDPYIEIKVEPAIYRVRVYIANSSLLEESDNEYYTIEIWLDHYIARKLLK